MSVQDRYQHAFVENKWRSDWERVKLDTPRIEGAKKPFYNLMMFPYPSAEGLHVGNMYAFTGSDIYGRFKRMQGYDVFEPIGLDGFGIHSENYALKVGRHPMDHAARTQENFYNQLHTIGAMYDWTRTVETYDPDYYRWTQWLFVQMFKHGLAYRGKAQVNWCPSCKTVLADEQVIDEKCERCGKVVEKRLLEQWFFRITAYAGKLLDSSFSLDWSEKVRAAQQQWIGKKEGINISYPIKGTKESVACFTTAPVNFGMTFIVLSPEHELVEKMVSGALSLPNGKIEEIKQYIKISKSNKNPFKDKEKTGVFTGLFASNHVAGWDVPIWIADFVLKEVGTGAVQGCPGHDYRDFEFAKKYKLPIIRVVVGPDGDTSPIASKEKVIVSGMPGTMVNSKFLDGMDFAKGLQATMDYIEKNGWGKRVTTYHLRDWLISRQRYWGPPIPMIHCKTCLAQGNGERQDMPGWYSVPESQLPVLLPRIEDYKPGDDGIAPLAKHKEFYETSCPGCGGKATRETDVSDTFLDSSWYFLRYPSTRSARSGQVPFDPDLTKKWLPVHMYTGGAEHSVLHLMYSRFVAMALHDWGYIDFEEPFTKFYAHGLVIKDGAKMSKSKGNVVNPDEYIANYGADALRLYLMFTGPYDQGGDFRDSAMEGMSRWVQKVWRMAQNSLVKHSSGSSATIKKALHRAIKKVGEDIERRHYNTAISAMMEFVNAVVEDGLPAGKAGGVLGVDDLGEFLKILAPFAPYITEELWSRLLALSSGSKIHRSPKKLDNEVKTPSQYTFTKSNSIHFQPWPAFDPQLLEEGTVRIIVQVNGKLRDTVVVSREISVVQQEVENAARVSTNVAKYLTGQTVKTVIFVPAKLVNFVLAKKE